MSVPACCSPPFNYTWSTGQQTINTNDTSNSITGLCSGSYWVKISSCNYNPDTLHYTLIDTIPLEPQITANGPISFCEGDSVILSSNYGNGNQWNNGMGNTKDITVTQGGYYVVTVTDTNGCILESDSIQITVVTNPIPAITGGGTEICKGDTVILSSNYSSGNNWNNGTDTTQYLTVYESGNYFVTVENNSGCKGSDTIKIRVYELFIHFSTEPEVCMIGNGMVKIDSISNGIKPFSYSWEGQPLIGSNSINNLKAGVYRIFVTDSNGCSCSDSVIIEAISVKADFSYEKLPCTNQIQFMNRSTDTLLSFWSFGDGTTSIERHPLHPYGANKNYSVMLIANSYNEGADTTEAEISIENYSFTDSLFIPNVFSPNGDGYNDYFEIIGADNPCIGIQKLSIFNRWGKKVFEVEVNKLKWDGTNNGNKLKEGVYFYTLEGKEFKKSGS